MAKTRWISRVVVWAAWSSVLAHADGVTKPWEPPPIAPPPPGCKAIAKGTARPLPEQEADVTQAAVRRTRDCFQAAKKRGSPAHGTVEVGYDWTPDCHVSPYLAHSIGDRVLDACVVRAFASKLVTPGFQGLRFPMVLQPSDPPPVDRDSNPGPLLNDVTAPLRKALEGCKFTQKGRSYKAVVWVKRKKGVGQVFGVGIEPVAAGDDAVANCLADVVEQMAFPAPVAPLELLYLDL
jgi:hypothetical protein